MPRNAKNSCNQTTCRCVHPMRFGPPEKYRDGQHGFGSTEIAMGKQLTRRDVVKLSSVAGAALSAGTTPAHAAPNPAGWRGTERIERIATNCEMCFWRCGACITGGRRLSPLGHGVL